MTPRRYAARTVAVLVLLLCVSCGSDATTTAPAATTVAVVPRSAPTNQLTPSPEPSKVAPTRVPQPTEAIDTPQGGLVVAGIVTTTLVLTQAELAALPTVDVPSEVTGGDELRGPRLDDVLGRAGVQADAREAVFSAADGSTLVRPLDELVGRFDVLLAVSADGRLRLIDPRQDDPIVLDNLVRIEVR